MYLYNVKKPVWAIMRGFRKCCQKGSTFDNVFFFYFILSWWGERGSKYHYKWVMIGPPAKCHRNGISLACRWWPNIEYWLCSFAMWPKMKQEKNIICRNASSPDTLLVLRTSWLIELINYIKRDQYRIVQQHLTFIYKLSVFYDIVNSFWQTLWSMLTV